MADVPDPDFLLRTAFRVSHLFFYQPLAGWPRHGLWVSIFSPWRGRPLQFIVVSLPLPPHYLYCFLLLFDVFCRPHVYCGCWLLARRPVIHTSCSRVGRGVLSRCGLCFLVISCQLTPAEVSGRAVGAREEGVKSKHGPPGLSFAPPTHPVVSAVTLFVFLVVCPGVLLRCCVIHDGCC